MKDKEPWKIFAELKQGVPYIKEETDKHDTHDKHNTHDDENKEDDKNDNL